MEKVDFSSLDFQNKRDFSHKVFFNVARIRNVTGNIEFSDCTFEDKLIVSGNSKSIAIRFTRCVLSEIEVFDKTEWLCFHNCSFILYHQKPESEIENLSISASKETYKIGSIVFENAKTGNFTIKDIAIDKIEANNHYFKDFKITTCKIICSFKSENTEYQSAFISFSQFSSISIGPIKNSEIRFYDVKSTFFNLVKQNSTSKCIFFNVRANQFMFSDFDNLDSIVHLQDIEIKDSFKIVNSNLGKSKFIDCKIESCRLETSLSVLTDVYSIRTNWPANIFYFELDQWATDERRFLEKMEFWRQLKVNAINQKNHFNALQFYTREMGVKLSAFKSFPQIIGKSKCTKILLWLINPIIDLIDLLFSSFKKRNAEGIMLWWHKYTSNFGVDWFRPTLLYLVLSFSIFFYLSEYSLTFNFQFDIFKDQNFYYFLDPLKGKKIEFTNHPTYIIAVVSMITSILQGLLIYQIIQGFRKYSFKS